NSAAKGRNGKRTEHQRKNPSAKAQHAERRLTKVSLHNPAFRHKNDSDNGEGPGPRRRESYCEDKSYRDKQEDKTQLQHAAVPTVISRCVLRQQQTTSGPVQ